MDDAVLPHVDAGELAVVAGPFMRDHLAVPEVTGRILRLVALEAVG